MLYAMLSKISVPSMLLLLLCVQGYGPYLPALRSKRLRSTLYSQEENAAKTQAFDYTSLKLVSLELARTCVPSILENVVQEDANVLALQLKTRDGMLLWLSLSWHPVTARVCLGYPPDKFDTADLYSFSATLKALLKAHILQAVEVPYAFERVARLDFSDRLGSKSKWSLYIEILGAKSNVVLVDNMNDNMIVSCAYQTPRDRNRVVQTNSQYRPPPVPLVSSPAAFLLDTTGGNFEKNLDIFYQTLQAVKSKGKTDRPMAVESALLSSFLGLSSAIVRAMLRASNIDGRSSTAQISREMFGALFVSFLQWLSVVSNPAVDEELLIDYRLRILEGKPVGYTVDFNATRLPNITSSLHFNQLLRVYYSDLEKSFTFNFYKEQCMKRLRSRNDKFLSLLKDFQGKRLSMSVEKQAEVLREADLLTSFLHTWKDKDGHVTCLDFETQEEVKIVIPYGSTPMMVAKKLYNNAKKLRRSEDILDVLIKKVSGYLLYMSEINASLDALDRFRSNEDIIALKEIITELDAVQTVLYSIYNNAQQEDNSSNYSASNANSNSKSESTVKHSNQKQKKIKSKATGSPRSKEQNPTTATRKSLKGLLVLENKNVDKELSPFRVPLVVGRNSKQNDRVSFDIARNHHIWFHVQGSPGSHCLLLLQPGEQAIDDQIQSAADVAAFYSKARDSKNVAVGYCSPKFLRRAPGGVPGLVQVAEQEGMVYGCPDRGETFVKFYGPQATNNRYS